MRRRTFSREYKIEAVKLVTERGVSGGAGVAATLNVAESVFRRLAERGGPRGAGVCLSR